MENKNLTISTGLVAYTINEACEIRINPTDTAFIERLFDVFDALDQKQGTLEAEIKAAQPREIFAIARRADEEMRELIDGALGDGVSAAIFGDMNCYAYAEGLPVWANLLLALLDECDAVFVAQQKLTRPRIDKYTAKYQARKP